MKQLLTYLILLFICVTLFESCKKSEKDPFLSLRSRKARLTGEWKVDSYGERDDYKTIGDTSGAGITHDGKHVSLIYTQGIYGIDIFGNVNTHIYKINADGTYSSEFNYTMIAYEATIAGRHEYNFIEKEEGLWQFMGPTQETKNKECIVLEPHTADNIVKKNGSVLEEHHMNQDGTEHVRKYRIEMLTNKAVQLKTEYKVNSTYNYMLTDELKVGQSGSQSMTLVKE